MFAVVELKNFLSFKEVSFDFRKGKKGLKQFIAIYGENGSGKSNFVQSILFLYQSLRSFRSQDLLNQLSEKDVEEGPKKIINELLVRLKHSFSLDQYKMIESEGPLEVKYGFQYNGHDGVYELKYTDQIVYEKLYYYTGKQKGVLFEISFEDGKIQTSFFGKLFLNRRVKKEIELEIQKYWGKHSFLSILNRERMEKNKAYIDENYLSYVFDLVDMVNHMAIHYREDPHSESGKISDKPEGIPQDLMTGKIRKKNEWILRRSEKIFKNFFTQAYADIKDVFYKTDTQEDKIYYELFVRKMIGGKVRTIPFRYESAGTQRILEVIRELLGVFCGATVVYDEIDNGIHDLLLKSILTSMISEITGQLIITTHNTYLMESVDPKSVYVINTDYEGNKDVICLDEFPRIQATNNPRAMYLKGQFGGVPITDAIDYDEIIWQIQENKGENWNGEEQTEDGKGVWQNKTGE